VTRYAVAPPPPSEPGDHPPTGAVNRYVSELARWRLRREHELRALDELTRAHDDRDALEHDLTHSMTLYHAIAQRHDLLLATWESGHTGEAGDPQLDEDQRGWVGQLVWGVLEMPDGDAQALALPLPDALRLSDALAASLRGRIGADEDDIPMAERVQDAQAYLDGVRERVEEREGEPDEDLQQRLGALQEGLDALRERDDDSALPDLAGVIGALAAMDREVIVSRASSAHDRADREQAVAERDHLLARGEAVRALAEKVLNAVNPAPRLGIPDVEALGEVPQEEGPDLDAYVSNLERVARALEQAHSTYAAALAEYADLADRAERLASTLAGCGAPTSVDLAGMLTAAKECLHTRPADVRRAAALVAAQEAYLGELRTGS
jgi:hypothetical protein